jgi:hypothetical protein
MESQTHVKIPDYELLDLVCLCHAGLAQDSPETPTYYLNQILSRLDAFKYPGLREQIEIYLAEKKYLPEVKIELSK